MIEWIKGILSNAKDKSSARLINVMGAVAGTSLLVYDTVAHDGINIEAFGIFLAYCGGVYLGGKTLDRGDTNDKQ